MLVWTQIGIQAAKMDLNGCAKENMGVQNNQNIPKWGIQPNNIGKLV